jgi:multisubunit Na+/H+ antiporter MnhB subunit
VLGFVAVVVIILGGVQYTTSSGDPAKVKKAKDTILYGIIGLVVALLAYAIVNFVLSSLSNAS